MHIVAIRFSRLQLLRRLARVKRAALEGAAILASAVGLGRAAAELRAMVAVELRAAAMYTRVVLTAMAFKQARAPRPRLCVQYGAARGVKVRGRPRSSCLRVVHRAAFARSGLTSRDPKTLAAAIASVVAQRARYVARIVKRILRGATLARLRLGRPLAILLCSDAPAAAPYTADTS